jgi:hypothetical protein
MSQLVIWRDSVSAGDDVDAPHELVVHLGNESLRSFLAGLVRQSYLASIIGGRATWILENHPNGGRSLAVLAQQWAEPSFLVDPESPVSSYLERDIAPHLYFRYWCQVEPERVVAALRQGVPLPDRYGS